MAGWLSLNLKLKAFVDSSVWGYADELLKRIDDKYCWNASTGTYRYEDRNRSTSHVHMMLSAALGMMLDSTECLIFLNSSQSVSSKEDAVSTTQSPWLFAEIAMARIVRKQIPERPRPLREFTEKRAAAGPTIEYEIATALATLSDMTSKTLNMWYDRQEQRQGYALDALYEILPAY